MVIDYEGSRAIPNNQILVKMERTLGKGVCVCVCVCVCVLLMSVFTIGVHLIGERAGQPKVLGRGSKRRAAQ